MIDKSLPTEDLQIDTLRYYETHAESLIEKSQLPNGNGHSLLYPYFLLTHIFSTLVVERVMPVSILSSKVLQ